MNIAIVGMACRYPDANSPGELWENVLAQRQAFRRFPRERLNLEAYYSPNRTLPDTTYAQKGAFLEGYQFDRVKFRVVGDTYRSADLAHWLALDVAAETLADAGFSNSQDLPKETTGVFLGNTLTGELSRANTLRLRWPYVHSVVAAQLSAQGIDDATQQEMLTALEQRFKQPFPEIGEESLAGNLANTIAGRICNHFDLKGGGYSLDGACSSSLLAVANACAALVSKDLDVALAGGVDLSLDPFELIGFAKTGALTAEDMWVYDQRSQGFIPGEGCGFVTLMRSEDAIAQKRPIYALIKGWGISSDGHGGITRPEVAGQTLALQRAYRKAGFEIDTVAYFEGHGTGTHVGDTVELQTLGRARAKASFPAVISSVKANIGHTKAAAGIAGLIKATLALKEQILPPTTACVQPHAELTQANAPLKILKQGQIWSQSLPLRAGVSAMGFGGINTHIVLEGIATTPKESLTTTESQTMQMVTPEELYILGAENLERFQEQIEHLLTIAPRLSQAELGDLAATLGRKFKTNLPWRAALIVRNPQDLTNKLQTLLSWLTAKTLPTFQVNSEQTLFLGQKRTKPNIGFLFPGQAAPVYTNFENIWSNRYPKTQQLWSQVNFPETTDTQSTALAQPAIVLNSLIGLNILTQLGIRANTSLGHSLGELVALHWAGALDTQALLKLAEYRGQLMTELGNPSGTMASIKANVAEVQELLQDTDVQIACINSPHQTIIAGIDTEVAQVITQAELRGLKTVKLPVSRAFHSPLIAEIIPPWQKYLQGLDLAKLNKSIFSTITGKILKASDGNSQDTDLVSLLVSQITQPVLFQEAIETASGEVDLWLEVGPGQILSRLTEACVLTPVISLDVGSDSLGGLFKAVGAILTLNGNCDYQSLFSQRFNRPFSLDWQPQFLSNPCENVHHPSFIPQASTQLTENSREISESTSPTPESTESPLEVFRQLVAAKTELPAETIALDTRLLSDLHLNSISVAELVSQAYRHLGLTAPTSPTDYADASLGEIAATLEAKMSEQQQGISIEPDLPQGVADWIRPFCVVLQPTELPSSHPSLSSSGHWQLVTPANYPLQTSLAESLSTYPGTGLILCLPPQLQEPPVDLLVEASQKLLDNREIEHFILVQHGYGASAWARTLKLEYPQLKVAIVNVPVNHPQVVSWIGAEVQHLQDYTEAYYDDAGVRRSPQWQVLPVPTKAPLPLNSQDTIVVTGGGKGIAAECALALAKQTGVSLVLMGRSQPEEDSELNRNLQRMQQAGIQVDYVVADVTNLSQIKTALEPIIARGGEISGIIHGAGINRPQLISSLDAIAIQQTLEPKIQGLSHLLQSISPENLKLLVTFGSIIARTGLPGEADYGLANEWLGYLVDEFKQKYPDCHCLNIEWSVWSGAGMGERLGRLDSLRQQGITPITLDQGVDIFCKCLFSSWQDTSIVIAGRFGQPPTVQLPVPELPFLRFLEKPLVYYPHIELVVEAELSLDQDPYLHDHIFQGEIIFPGVMGLEAMTQVASTLLPQFTPLEFTNIAFKRPVIISANSSLKIRIAALQQPSGEVEVAIRSEKTGFVVDHFRATIASKTSDFLKSINIEDLPKSKTKIPAAQFYGNLFFHQGKFQCLDSYHYLQATECLAEIQTSKEDNWFNRYLPPTLLLGNPGRRDAAIHALQACIPQGTLLPIAVDKLTINPQATAKTTLIWAKERAHLDDIFIYDVLVINEQGEIIESWQGLQLKLAHSQNIQDNCHISLIIPYLQRRLAQLFPDFSGDMVLTQEPQTTETILTEITSNYKFSRRLDGKPELDQGQSVSVAHTLNLTLAVVGSSGCDLELVTPKTTLVWQDLLGTEGFNLAQTLGVMASESLDVSSTRVWSVQECLKKAGLRTNTPIVINTIETDNLVCFTAGQSSIVTWACNLQGLDAPLVMAILINRSPINAYL